MGSEKSIWLKNVLSKVTWISWHKQKSPQDEKYCFAPSGYFVISMKNYMKVINIIILIALLWQY